MKLTAKELVGKNGIALKVTVVVSKAFDLQAGRGHYLGHTFPRHIILAEIKEYGKDLCHIKYYEGEKEVLIYIKPTKTFTEEENPELLAKYKQHQMTANFNNELQHHFN